MRRLSCYALPLDALSLARGKFLESAIHRMGKAPARTLNMVSPTGPWGEVGAWSCFFIAYFSARSSSLSFDRLRAV